MRAVRKLAIQLLSYSATCWLFAGAVTAWLLLAHPFMGELDRGSILALAGLILAIVAVTFGLVAVTAQHLSETYSRSLVEALYKRSIWRMVVLGEGVGALYVVALSLWSPDMTSGAVGGVVLLASMIQSWRALTQLLHHFDPLGLIQVRRAEAVDHLNKAEHPDAVATTAAQTILSLMLSGAAKGDTDVIAEGMAAWNVLLLSYLKVAVLSWSDPLVSWIYARSEELVEQYAQESVGLVLPVVVEGLEALGKTTASYRNPVNPDFDEATWQMVRVLKTAVQVSGASRRSPAAPIAARGVGSIGQACVAASKFTTLQHPVSVLTQIGLGTATPAIDVASQASIALANLVILLANTESKDVMRYANAETATDGLQKIALAAGGEIGPAHFLVAPLSQSSLPRICQVLECAAAREPDATQAANWDRLASRMASFCCDLSNNAEVGHIVRCNAVESTGALIHGLLAVPLRQSIIELIERTTTRLLRVALEDADGRLSADQALSEALLAMYYAANAEPIATEAPRQVVLTTINATEQADEQMRWRLARGFRKIGAAAIQYGDNETAMAVAKAAPPRRPSMSKQIRLVEDAFEFPFGRSNTNLLTARGLVVQDWPNHHLNPQHQRAYLEVEQQTKSLG